MSKRKASSGKSRQLARSLGPDPGSRKRRQREEEVPEKVPAEFIRRRVPSSAAVRETIESVVIAFVLAFLFRTFEAEAFVIPTGSMAPTLMGRHKDVECPVCGNQFQVGASEEVNSETGASTGTLVTGGTCPMCRWPMYFGPDNEQGKGYPSFKGDRILVGKFAYQFDQPQRWDVAVFKFPGNAANNYIKRMVGLPGERIRIGHGDIKVQEESKEKFEIARKRPRKLLAMLQPVFDNDRMPKIMEKYSWPPRWQAVPSMAGGRLSAAKPQTNDTGASLRFAPATPGEWLPMEEGGSFQTDGSAKSETWLRYRHLVPSKLQWQKMHDGRLSSDEFPRPQLITDFCAYNTGELQPSRSYDVEHFGLHWVGDLVLECTVEVQSDSGEMILELVEGGRRMQCRIDVETGDAALQISGKDPQGRAAHTPDGEPYHPTAQTSIKGAGEYEIIFSNCDDQLLLWVDGSVVEFDTTTCYLPLHNTRPNDDDLSPAGIASKGAVMRVGHLKLLRDVYYIAVKPAPGAGANVQMSDFAGPLPYGFLSSPAYWDAFDNMREVTFELEADQFLALGDNSPKSKDGRLWEGDGIDYYVGRDMLIGKAFFIYWPHSWNRVPGTKIPFPLFPNFPEMGFVR